METDRSPRRSLVVRVLVSLVIVIAIGWALVAARSVRQPNEPTVDDARAQVIAKDKAALVAECQHAAAGDWQAWQRLTASYRKALKAKIDAINPNDPRRESRLTGLPPVLEGKDGFPLFEVQPRENLEYLYDGESLDKFCQDRYVVAAQRWLRQRGIDLVFVPVPKMTEVYIERFLDPCPDDGIVGPHVRHALLQLLEDGVEVVDGLPLFRRARDADAEYLYNAADTHWAPRAMQLIAREVADRLQRYPFAARARLAPSIVRTALAPFDVMTVPSKRKPGELPVLDGWAYLTGEQRKRVETAQVRTFAHVTLLDGSEPDDDPHSPVLLIGNSFVLNFRERLIKELNLLIRTRWTAADTTRQFNAFLREPEILDGCRVVVWVMSEHHMTRFFPMPESISKTLEKKEGAY